MRWDDRIFSGTRGNWSWLVVRERIPELTSLTAECHAGQRLCITAFDSGPIAPNPEMRDVGWTLIGDSNAAINLVGVFMVTVHLKHKADSACGPCNAHQHDGVAQLAPGHPMTHILARAAGCCSPGGATGESDSPESHWTRHSLLEHGGSCHCLFNAFDIAREIHGVDLFAQ